MPPGDTPAAAAAGAQSRAERLNTRAAGVVALAVLCSRVLGLAREQIFAALFGGGRVMDAFTIAFRIPNLLRDLFGVPALASSFFNLGSIIAGVALGYWLDPHFGPRAILGLAIGTLIGGALQLLVQLPALRQGGYAFHPDFRWREPGVRAILRLMGPSVIAASTTQVNVLVNSVFASQLGDGPTFWLTVAFRLMQLPLGIFGVALGTVALPLLARMAASGNTPAFRLGSSRAGVLHRLRRHQQLPHSVFPHALAPRAPGIAGDARAAVEGGAGLGGAAGDFLGGSALAARRLGGATLLAEVREPAACHRQRRWRVLPLCQRPRDRRSRRDRARRASQGASRRVRLVPPRAQADAGNRGAQARALIQH